MKNLLFLSFFIFSVNIINAQVEFVEIASGFIDPVAIANADDGTNRLFVVERAGRIKIIDDLATGNVVATPFLDISSRVNSGGEEGLLGLAFHPNYPDTPHFYVNYTDIENSQRLTRIERYSVSGDPNIADFNSNLQIMQVVQLFSNHNAGDIKFGPDNYLYITMGDGGAGGDPQNVAQDSTNLLGSLLRVDVSGDDFPADPFAFYKIPPDNPFVLRPGFRDEFWSIGLRNPWRISFDRQTGDLWIADVGQNSLEEVNFQAASSSGGQNYGWSCREGNQPATFNPCIPGPLTDPIFVYPRNLGVSITGGFVYRGTSFPSLQGYYMCADYAFNNFWLINSSDFNDVTRISGVANISSFGESEGGELYVVGLNSGRVHRIFASGLCENFVTVTNHTEDEYRANIRINSDAPIGLGRTINYASPEIEIDQPFEVATSSIFEAESLTCLEKIHQTNN